MDVFQELRGSIDGRDGFMRGHQIIKKKRLRRDIPEWTKSDRKIQEILLRSFPKLRTDYKQRKLAARMARIIHLYFRVGSPRNEIVEELDINQNLFRVLLNGIRRAGKGLTKNGRERKRKYALPS